MTDQEKMKVDSDLINMPNDLDKLSAVKDLVIQRLVDDGLITNEQALHYANDWQIIIFKKSWFRRAKDIFKGKIDGYFAQYVKLADSYKPEKDENISKLPKGE